MANGATSGKFTGKHMAAVLVIGFGIVAAVNFYMASLATGGFHGVVVENSYVASQKFNDWIAEAEADKALGWEAQAARSEDGRITLSTSGVPAGATVTAQLRRPIGTKQFASLTFTPEAGGTFISDMPVSDGRWTMRLTIEADGQSWSQEGEI